MGPLDELQRLLGAQGPPASRLTPPSEGGLLDLTPAEWAAFMRRLPMSDIGGEDTPQGQAPIGGYTGDPRFQRDPLPSRELQAPFSFGVGIEKVPHQPLDYWGGANFRLDPFEVGITAGRGRPHFGGSLMYRQRIPF